MKTQAKFNRLPAKRLIPTLGFFAALAAVLPVSAKADDPPTISAIGDVLINVNGSSGDLPFTIGDTETPADELTVKTIISSEYLAPHFTIAVAGSGADRTIRLTSIRANVVGTTRIAVTVKDSASQIATSEFSLKISNSTLSTGIQVLETTAGLGWIAPVNNPSLQAGFLTESMGTFAGPFEIYSSLDLGGQTADLSGIGNFIALSNARLINLPNGTVAIDGDAGLKLESLNKYLFAYFQASNLRKWAFEQGPPPDPNSPEIGSDFSGVFREKGFWIDSQPVVKQDENHVFQNSAWHYTREFSRFGAPAVTTPAIGLIYKDSVSNAIDAGDSVPARLVEPPPNTGSTFTEFDPGGISINANYVAFYGKGDLFSGVYTRRLSDGELFAAVESFPFQQGDLGLIWGAFLAGERDLFFNATGGVYHADAEGATPAELILANGTEFEPGKTFNSGNLLHLAGDYGVIAGADGDGKSTIFRLNLTDFSLEQIVQQGDAAPGGEIFGLVQRPAVSDTMVVFEGFDDSFQFLGLFACLLETKELKTIARVGDIIDGKEVRTLGSQPGALDGSVFGFTAYFTDNSSAAYLTTPAVSFSVPFLNISTRSSVQTDDNVLILGYIITANPAAKRNAPLANGAKKVIIRAIGPSLGGAGVQGPLADPVLELYDSTPTLITSNDNWRDTQEQEIIDSTVPPSDDLESAIVATLDPGAYTAIVRGKNGGTGVGLVEIYDLDGAAVSEQANISTRSFVQTDENVMIGGIIVGGTAGTASTIVVRAIGPSLADAGVANPLQDPILELHDSTGALIASNDNWKDTQQAEIEAAQLAPADDRESALEAALGPGAYTAIVRGSGGTAGVALVEAYNLEASGAGTAFPVSLTNRR